METPLFTKIIHILLIFFLSIIFSISIIFFIADNYRANSFHKLTEEILQIVKENQNKIITIC